MLTEFLQDIGLHRGGSDLDLAAHLEPFSKWVAEQTVEEDDRFYLASRIGAFICEFLVDHHAAERRIEGKQILIRMPVAESVARDFDPYSVALGITDGNGTLADFLSALTANTDNTA